MRLLVVIVKIEFAQRVVDEMSVDEQELDGRGEIDGELAELDVGLKELEAFAVVVVELGGVRLRLEQFAQVVQVELDQVVGGDFVDLNELVVEDVLFVEEVSDGPVDFVEALLVVELVVHFAQVDQKVGVDFFQRLY